MEKKEKPAKRACYMGFRLVNSIFVWGKFSYEPQEIYDTATLARDVAIENVKIVIGYQ